MGLHARLATMLVRSIYDLDCEISIEKDGFYANAKSALDVLTLAAEQGSDILVRAEGPDAKRAVETIEKLICGRFGEN